jgi:hypothetical protein
MKFEPSKTKTLHVECAHVYVFLVSYPVVFFFVLGIRHYAQATISSFGHLHMVLAEIEMFF